VTIVRFICACTTVSSCTIPLLFISNKVGTPCVCGAVLIIYSVFVIAYGGTVHSVSTFAGENDFTLKTIGKKLNH
jgi:hypothetical protein